MYVTATVVPAPPHNGRMQVATLCSPILHDVEHSPISMQPRRSILRPRQPPPITPLSLDICHRIPTEVFSIIIDRIARFDVPTLRVCSLVCKTWLAVSRSHLIPTLSLNAKNTKSFLRLLNSPHATISRGVHHVSVQGDSDAISHRKSRESRIYPVDMIINGGTLTCDESLLLRSLAPFPSLTSLSFSWLRDGLSPPTSAALICGFPGLTDLEFRTCSFPSFTEFARTVCALQALRRLALADVTWDDLSLPECDPASESASSSFKRPPAGLQTLELYLSPIGHLCTWLAGHSDALVQLETVRLCSAFWEDVDAVAIAWMLRRLGRKVRHLSLPWHLPEVDLSHHTELRTLRISHLWFKPYAEAAAEDCFTTRGIEKTLLQLNSAYIRSIEFRVLLVFGGELGLDWEKMRRILARKCFAGLQLLTFGLPVLDRKVRAILRKLWGGATDVNESRRRSRRRLTRLQVDEVFGP
ncbi:hypothetical protein D9615_005034 [Tricholomella constricta]|uniref:F-box domain-containing protein n=1 Tax=Tricholomella constricta TaxID=117010 RepID=A0A8H5M719_9AGAR|nr:hypothetical protein D9615_005034 [Tricholomella constricta]